MPSLAALSPAAPAPPDAWPGVAGRLGLGLVGAAALLLGLMVYLSDRWADPATGVPPVQWPAGQTLFGSFGPWLPSFVHTLAFSLFTVAALPACAAPRYGVCAAWGAVNLVFELGQHAAIKVGLAAGLQDLFGHSSAVRWLANYFLRGTFSVADVMATLGGALAAAALLGLLQRKHQEHPHAP